ncbi:DUF4097 family beta strand repeat-containing protein [Pedobacter rhodius]|uniref:DUF4097 family beta strand repeat-containing protein n=1 Tax=Pedobacter rhodius TaxID=3004098 RepID=A0ABT4KY12_9SPHI|nr:DUF4097 family beta strand repeat-containing protein [Pedobacter sp. SJ11]MCZ4223812.1 DUF4097 family beta strand repeat-containing protein [Pedobacter sp. SJ11]
MKKQLAVLFTLVAITISASAQKEYKLAKSSGKLNLNIGGAIVEGYSGNEIIFSMAKSENDVVDERAKGLRVISGSGFADNTGMGIDVSEKGDEINVNPVRKGVLTGIVTIKVPQNIKIAFNNTNVNQDELILKNLKNEIEISVSYTKIKLENNTGPMNVKTLYGSVDAIFNGEIKGPVSIVSVYGYVDVSMPATTKANVELGTSYGNLYAGEGFKIAVEKSTNEKTESAGTINSVQGLTKTTGYSINSQGSVIGLNSYSSRDRETLKGKLNGGGADVILKSNYKNVYLREK